MDEKTYSVLNGDIAFGKSYEKDGITFIPFAKIRQTSRGSHSYRVTAINNVGEEIGGGVSGYGGNNIGSSTYNFHTPKGNIKEFRYQRRPYEWVEFKNVSLKPGNKTDIKTTIEAPATNTTEKKTGTNAYPIIPIEIDTKTDFLDGDSIEITGILGTSSKIEPGNTYTIKGKYKLSSRDLAQIHLLSTNGVTSCDNGQIIKRGDGEFTRQLEFIKGDKDSPMQAKFVPVNDNQSFGNLFFGNKKFITDIAEDAPDKAMALMEILEDTHRAAIDALEKDNIENAIVILETQRPYIELLLKKIDGFDTQEMLTIFSKQFLAVNNMLTDGKIEKAKATLKALASTGSELEHMVEKAAKNAELKTSQKSKPLTRPAYIPSTSIINDQGCIEDKIDHPFINDPKVIGGWKSVDFVREINNFSPDKQNWQGDLFLKSLIFKEDGKLKGDYLTWTKGLVLHKNDKTASKYSIKTIDDKDYMFLEWKSGDYTIRYRKPQYYVLKKQ